MHAWQLPVLSQLPALGGGGSPEPPAPPASLEPPVPPAPPEPPELHCQAPAHSSEHSLQTTHSASSSSKAVADCTQLARQSASPGAQACTQAPALLQLGSCAHARACGPQTVATAWPAQAPHCSVSANAAVALGASAASAGSSSMAPAEQAAKAVASKLPARTVTMVYFIDGLSSCPPP